MAITLVGCDKKVATPEKTEEENPTDTTNGVEGQWKIKIFDGVPVDSPRAGFFIANANTNTGGTVHFDMTLNGTTHMTEYATYTLSSSNTRISFTKTSGTDSILSWRNWAVDTMTNNVIYIRSLTDSFHMKMTR